MPDADRASHLHHTNGGDTRLRQRLSRRRSACADAHLRRTAGVLHHRGWPAGAGLLIWTFTDFADRKAKRAALSAVPEWTAFLGRAAPMVHHHESRLMTSVIPLGLPDAQP